MSVELVEGAISAGAGALDYAIQQRVSRRLPGNIPMVIGFEAALLATGLWGHFVGLKGGNKDAALHAGLVLAGRRATALAMAGKLTTPSQWAGVGGDGMTAPAGAEGGWGGAGRPVGPGTIRALPNAPQIRQIGMGGSYFGLAGATSEAAGVAG